MVSLANGRYGQIITRSGLTEQPNGHQRRARFVDQGFIPGTAIDPSTEVAAIAALDGFPAEHPVLHPQRRVFSARWRRHQFRKAKLNRATFGLLKPDRHAVAQRLAGLWIDLANLRVILARSLVILVGQLPKPFAVVEVVLR